MAVEVVKNLWGITKFYCSHRHEVPVEMTYKMGASSMFYSCPNYYVANNELTNNRSCTNRLSFDDAEAIIIILSDYIIKHEKKGRDNLDLTGLTFSYKQILVKVIKYSLAEVHLEILNKKAIR